MKQYLLSIYQPDGPPPPEVAARMDQIMADLNSLVQEAKAIVQRKDIGLAGPFLEFNGNVLG